MRSKDVSECTQHGQLTPELRNILVHELRQLGLPAKAPGETYFTVLEIETGPVGRWLRPITRIVLDLT